MINIIKTIFGQNLLQKYKRNYKGKVNISYNEENGLYTIKYLHAGVDFSDKNLRIARGLTLDKWGNVITMGFHKFFNYKQLETYTTYDDNFKEKYSRIQKVDEKLTAYDKLDGTLLILSIYKNDFIVATTSSTRTDWSKQAVEYFNSLENASELKAYLKDNNLSLIFEYTAWNNQIVIKYQDVSYTLIGMANNKTLENYSYEEFSKIAEKFDLKLVTIYEYTLQELLEEQKTNETTEGWVVVNSYGNLIKFKTDYWFREKEEQGMDLFFGNRLTKRKAMIIIKAYIEDEIDDLLAYKNQHGAFSQSTYVEEVMKVINDFVDQVNLAIVEHGSKTSREIVELGLERNLQNALIAHSKGSNWRTNEMLLKNVVFQAVF